MGVDDIEYGLFLDPGYSRIASMVLILSLCGIADLRIVGGRCMAFEIYHRSNT